MVAVGPWVEKRIVITGRTYPTPSRKSIETNCTGGITDDGQPIRLYPIPYRLLPEDKRFAKWQPIRARVAKSSDSRPESHHVDIDSIRTDGKPISTGNSWTARKRLIEPLVAASLCDLQRTRDERGYPTMGWFRPRVIRRLRIEHESADWSDDEKGKLNQHVLFGNVPRTPLEKVPFKFIYDFTCDDSACNGHSLSCIDWEVGESYRK